MTSSWSPFEQHASHSVNSRAQASLVFGLNFILKLEIGVFKETIFQIWRSPCFEALERKFKREASIGLRLLETSVKSCFFCDLGRVGVKSYQFDKNRSDCYDNDIRRSILGYEALHSLTARLAKTLKPNMRKVLLIGAGTGQELESFSNASEDCHFTIVEPSAEMRYRCIIRINELSLQSRVTGIYPTLDEVPENHLFDCVTLLLVLHFVPDNGEKKNLVEKIFRHMEQNSFLFIADLCLESSEADHYLLDTWRNSMLIEGTTTEEVEDFFSNRLPLVHRVSLDRSLSLLSEAGFKNLEVFFSSLLFRAWLVRKSETDHSRGPGS